MAKKIKCHCSGWATRNDLLCGDGRTIRKDAFKDDDGRQVPLIWNHDHSSPEFVLGHAILENGDDGVRAHITFNESKLGQKAKHLVECGDVRSLSIWANKLKQIGNDVIHGKIREVSLVLAGANPGAFVDFVMAHSDSEEDYFIASWDENAIIIHSDDNDDEVEEQTQETSKETTEEETVNDETLQHAEEESKDSGETVGEVFERAMKKLDEDEQNAVYYVVGKAIEKEGETDNVEHNDESEDNEGGNTSMKNNIFDQTEQQSGTFISHADQEKILSMAKSNTCGSFQAALSAFIEDSQSLSHGFDDKDLELLFPEYKDTTPGAPELITRDQGWVSDVMKKVSKSPFSRIRTRKMDARGADLRASGYKKGDKKNVAGNPKLINRTTDPQTIYRKDALHRDDIIDMTDFDIVAYQWNLMRMNLNEDIALAILVGDGLEDGAEGKIEETHVRSIWHDDDLYCIHVTVDIAAAKAELQGTETGAHFGDNYVYAEAVVTANLYAREQYKGSGNLTFYCTPHLLNKMLLARDLNGRRIYSSKSDLSAALNVSDIQTVEQFDGLTRVDKNGKTKKLLGLFVNLVDYKVGATKGGEITKFTQFDIDYNQEKYLIETRISGALDRISSAIALEEDVVEAGE